ADLTIDRVKHLDLYSCFPIAPRLTAAMLGIAADDARALTVTGGLPWFGGPGNNYTTHAIAALVARLRAAQDGFGLVHANGWHLTKHALGIYGASPPPRGWQRAGGAALQAWVEAEPHPVVIPEAMGRASVEAYTVMHGRDGAPDHGTAIGRLAGGERFIAVLPRDVAAPEPLDPLRDRVEQAPALGPGEPRDDRCQRPRHVGEHRPELARFTRELRELDTLLRDVAEARGAKRVRERTVGGQIEEPGRGRIRRRDRQHAGQLFHRDRDPRVGLRGRPGRHGDPAAVMHRPAKPS